jgi:hypothetical protein
MFKNIGGGEIADLPEEVKVGWGMELVVVIVEDVTFAPGFFGAESTVSFLGERRCGL